SRNIATARRALGRRRVRFLPQARPAIRCAGQIDEGSQMSLQDKVAIVTGAASGIGKEIAKEFFANGAKVAIADLNIDAATATARELDASGQRAIGVAMNVT